MSTICSHMMQEILDMWRRCRQDPLSWKPVPRPALRCSMETRWDFWDVWDVWDVCHSSKGLIKIARIASQVQEALEEILPPISLHVALSLFPFALCNTYVVFSPPNICLIKVKLTTVPGRAWKSLQQRRKKGLPLQRTDMGSADAKWWNRIAVCWRHLLMLVLFGGIVMIFQPLMLSNWSKGHLL